MTSHDVSVLLVRELRAFQREIELFPDDALVWSTLPGIANSAGLLALHVSGNLQHFVGAVLGRTGYVRDRDAEFRPRVGTRQEVLAQLEAAIQVVEQVLPHTIDEGEFPQPVAGMRMRTGLFLAHLCAHAAYHLGQAGYLRRALCEDDRTSNALPLQPLSL